LAVAFGMKGVVILSSINFVCILGTVNSQKPLEIQGKTE
jgi:hypothetical protein